MAPTQRMNGSRFMIKKQWLGAALVGGACSMSPVLHADTTLDDLRKTVEAQQQAIDKLQKQLDATAAAVEEGAVLARAGQQVRTMRKAVPRALAVTASCTTTISTARRSSTFTASCCLSPTNSPIPSASTPKCNSSTA